MIVGLRGVKPRAAAGGSAVARRKATAGPVYQKIFTQAHARPGQNPYRRAVSLMKPEDDRGKLTGEGMERLIEAAWWGVSPAAPCCAEVGPNVSRVIVER